MDGLCREVSAAACFVYCCFLGVLLNIQLPTLQTNSAATASITMVYLQIIIATVFFTLSLVFIFLWHLSTDSSLNTSAVFALLTSCLMGVSHLIELIGVGPVVKNINGRYSSLVQNGEWIACLPVLLCLFGHVFKIQERLVLVGAGFQLLGAITLFLVCISTTKVILLLLGFAWVLFFLPALVVLCIISLPMDEFASIPRLHEIKLYGWANLLIYVGYGTLLFSNVGEAMSFESQRIFAVSFDLFWVISLFVVIFREQLKGHVSSVEDKLVDMEKANSAQKLFLRFVFHEVRVPFHSLVLGLEHLASQPNMGNHQTLLSMLMQSAEMMQRTINDVLLLSRLEDGKLELEANPFSMIDMATTTLATFEMMAKEKSVNITLQIDPSFPRLLLGDQHRISEILANLISNGLKFSKENQSLAVFINVLDQSRHNCYFQVKVQDEGIGMTPEDQKLLFLPFSQIRPGETQKGKGSGLGLSIIKHIVELYGGSIRVMSDLGKGSTFFVSLALPIVPCSPRMDSSSSFSSYSEPRFMMDSAGNTFDGPMRMQQTQIMLPGNDESMCLEEHGMLKIHPAEKKISENEGTGASKSRRNNKIVPYTVNGSRSAMESLYEDAVSPSQKQSTKRNLTMIAPLSSSASQFPMDPLYEGSFSPSHDSSLTPSEPSGMSSFNEQPFEKKVHFTDLRKLSPVSVSKFEQPELRVDGSHIKCKVIRPEESSIKPSSEPSGMVLCKELSFEKKTNFTDLRITSHVSDNNQGQTALVVDDSHMNRKLTRLVLEQEGFAVDEACNGEEAVKMAYEKSYSIIFMDNQMPVMDGVEATRQITQARACVVIGLTGNSLDEDVSAFLKAGAKEVLIKPCKRENMLRSLTFIALSA